MTAQYDVMVLGAGPAGASAALEAAALGLSVLLLDEAREAGGQVHRAPSPALGSDETRGEGAALRAALAASPVTCRFERRVWLLERDYRAIALGPDGSEAYSAPTLIVAAGATERHLPCPGWTLPGVFGLAAATVLLKAEGMLPGRRVVVAGTGPLLALVAATILTSGGSVAAVVDAHRRRDWFRAAPHLAVRPDLLARGASWLARIAVARVPILSGHAVTAVEGEERVRNVLVSPVSPDGTPDRTAPPRRFDADAVCLGYGLIPATEATRLLGAKHVFDSTRGGWIPDTDADQTTSLPGLFVCGDGAGLEGAAAAPLSGRIAARSAARHLGRLDGAAAAGLARLRAARSRAARFGRVMAALASPPPGLIDLATAETSICRCEAVTRATIEQAIAAGAATVNAVKAATRCGMGPCGGRLCAEPAAALIARMTGRQRAEVAPATPRPPLRPVTLGALTGTFRYEDLPITEPGPP